MPDLPNVVRHGVAVVAVLAAAAGLGACSALPDAVRDYGPGDETLELTEVPFFPQERYQCGPAALATALVDSGVDTTPDRLVDQVYLPGRQGSLQAEMTAATRSAGRIPYPVDASLSALSAELRAGRPVLVLQNLGVSWSPRWHYAVVVGIDPDRHTVTLRSGTDAQRVTAADTFLRTWRRADYWGLVVLPPGSLPANVDRARYFDAVSAVEATGHMAEAHEAWLAALRRWPDAAVARFGAALTAYELGRPRDAAMWYRQLLDEQPEMLGARNNLALALAAQGKHEDALREIETVLHAVANDDPLVAQYRETYTQILSASH